VPYSEYYTAYIVTTRKTESMTDNANRLYTLNRIINVLKFDYKNKLYAFKRNLTLLKV